MKLHVVDTGYFKLDGGAMFGVVPKSIWNRLHPADDNNLCNWAMRCLLIEDEGRQIVYMADLLPSVHHIPIPYVMAYDMFPLKTLEEKKAFLTEAVKNNYVLFFEHDPLHECCDLMVTDRGIRPANYFKLSDL